MFKKLKTKLNAKLQSRKRNSAGIFTESTLKTSFYEELQKNGWCDIVDDKPDDLTKIIQINIRKTIKV